MAGYVPVLPLLLKEFAILALFLFAVNLPSNSIISISTQTSPLKETIQSKG